MNDTSPHTLLDHLLDHLPMTWWETDGTNEADGHPQLTDSAGRGALDDARTVRRFLDFAPRGLHP
ncbi:hypothetical protein [Streptomyces sp. MST-110588]|uniref:hypothetical protein n=1 Tax=Streptomyces sp. MST-110588 TaxID=2833628 RepID=UPI001F5D0F4B|nr:hypothetical protein [Streptomyces sp. MST-110588]